ncbi:mitochondrial Complex1_LYR family protein [Andalucia godoyi]|uniref:Mitochondrial Complex1_LYR family protein n=1 Tax=Andalucia godoyi TaxID=505711 RepID=A0A8K0AG14_ANDGO|nr:mitochondrial Complex1_LYR family protein [Andalucia godoyi]|eukprot:ANDGO_01760.mRNA.1 mitochondrial Complex1_LYR family protein
METITKLLNTAAPHVQTSLSRQRREVLCLYRDILRVARRFSWNSESGHPWSVILQQSARKEFESAKQEKDPEVIARLLVVGRDCLDKTVNAYHDQWEKLKSNIESSRNDPPRKP